MLVLLQKPVVGILSSGQERAGVLLEFASFPVAGEVLLLPFVMVIDPVNLFADRHSLPLDVDCKLILLFLLLAHNRNLLEFEMVDFQIQAGGPRQRA